MEKKGDFGWGELGKIMLAIIFLLILVIIIGLLTGKSNAIFDVVSDFIRFGR